jgi:hypothetical protein
LVGQTHFSETIRIFYKFYKNLLFSGIFKTAGTFYTQGLASPLWLTEGPKPPQPPHRPGRPRPQRFVLGSHARARRHARLWAPAGRPAAEQGAGAREGKGEGAAAHPGRESGLGDGGEGQATANQGARARAGCRKNGDDGVYSWRSGSIPSAKIKRTARQSSGARHRSSGRPGAPAMVGYSGGARVCRAR